MARKSRRNIVEDTPGKEIRRWKTALYGRLSNVNGGKETDQSLTFQMAYLQEYVKEHPQFQVVDVYTDNGRTGRNFDRPDFQRLLEDIINEKIDCIIVKDLSRFGRNYLETGDYLEKMFPMLGIRFIAINDHYDSEATAKNSQIAVPIKDMLNEMYSKDLSRKVHASFEIKKRKGELQLSLPFGYTKNPENPSQLIWDDEMAPVIYEIFEWFEQGYTSNQIMHRLNTLQVAIPAERKIQLGMSKKKHIAKGLWRRRDITRILSDPVYTGCMVYERFIYSGARYRMVGEKPMDEWRIVENTHKAYITWEKYKQIRDILDHEAASEKATARKTARIPSEKELETIPETFHGKLFCLECGKPMRFGYFPKKAEVYTYGSYHCTCKESKHKEIRDDDLKIIVMNQIALQLYAGTEYEKIKKSLMSTTPYLKKLSTFQKEKQQLLKEKVRVQNKRKQLYEDYTEQLLFENEFLILKKSFEEEYLSVSDAIEELDKKLEILEHSKKEQEELMLQKNLAGDLKEFSDILLESMVKKMEYGSEGIVQIQFFFTDWIEKKKCLEELL